MTKKSRASQSSNRTIIIVALTVLALIAGGAAWISTANSASTTAPVLPPNGSHRSNIKMSSVMALLTCSSMFVHQRNLPLVTSNTRSISRLKLYKPDWMKCQGVLLSWSTAAAAIAAPPQRRYLSRAAINQCTISVESKIGWRRVCRSNNEDLIPTPHNV